LDPLPIECVRIEGSIPDLLKVSLNKSIATL
jgi:hypothetical protein